MRTNLRKARREKKTHSGHIIVVIDIPRENKERGEGIPEDFFPGGKKAVINVCMSEVL